MQTNQVKSRLGSITARDIMSDQVVVVNEKMSVSQVAHLMLRERVSGYPIVSDTGEVVGIVTLTDLFILVDKIAQEQSAGLVQDQNWLQAISKCKHMPIGEIMTKNVILIDPDTSLIEIAETVVKWRIHTFPVVEENKLVGIVGRHDILNAIFSYG